MSPFFFFEQKEYLYMAATRIIKMHINKGKNVACALPAKIDTK